MKAWQLIEKPENWCQGSNARDRHEAVSVDAANACRWCAWGAILKCYQDYGACMTAEFKLQKKIGSRRITNWNDARGRTHAEVLAALKEADV